MNNYPTWFVFLDPQFKFLSWFRGSYYFLTCVVIKDVKNGTFS